MLEPGPINDRTTDPSVEAASAGATESRHRKAREAAVVLGLTAVAAFSLSPFMNKFHDAVDYLRDPNRTELPAAPAEPLGTGTALNPDSHLAQLVGVEPIDHDARG